MIKHIACLLALALSVPSLAHARGGNPAPAPATITLISAALETCPVAFGCTAPIVAKDHTLTITIIAQSDGNDNPWIAQTAGPAFAPTMAFAAGRSPDARGSTLGSQYATWEWTPTQSDVGSDVSATFLITTKSGATLTVNIPIGIIAETPDATLVTDFIATPIGDQLALHWNAPGDDHVTFYRLMVCLAQDPSIGSPVCIEQAMPGVKSVTEPSGTETQAAISAIAQAGSFPSPAINFKITSAPYPSAPTPLAYLHLIAANTTSVAGAQDYVIKLP